MEGSSGIAVFPIMTFGNWEKAMLLMSMHNRNDNLILSIGDPDFSLKLRKNGEKQRSERNFLYV